MYPKKLLSGALITGSLFLTGVASAGVLTINPQNTNNGNAYQVSAAQGAFFADGATTALNSVLTIDTASNFTETGRVDITNFTLASAISGANPQGLVAAGVGFLGTYTVYADINFAGAGVWSPCLGCSPGGFQYTVTGGTFSFELFAKNNSLVGPLHLGTGTIHSFVLPPIAIIINDGNHGYTSLNGLFDFAPTAGVTGTNGFFVAPDPFLIQISTGNFGGNQSNTTYTGTVATGVVVNTPGSGLGPVTGNLNFVTVPEPGALSLAGIALLGLALASRRKAKAGPAA